MGLIHVARVPISTSRLVLHPSDRSRALRAYQIQSDWDVARMLRMASYPPSIEGMEAWFASHENEWLMGTAYRFAVELSGSMIGLVDIDEIAEGSGELGYWFDKASWGNGFAYEAAEAAVNFSTSIIGLQTLSSSHAVDNPKSGAVLLKLGFKTTSLSMKKSRPRGMDVLHQNYELQAG